MPNCGFGPAEAVIGIWFTNLQYGVVLGISLTRVVWVEWLVVRHWFAELPCACLSVCLLSAVHALGISLFLLSFNLFYIYEVACLATAYIMPPPSDQRHNVDPPEEITSEAVRGFLTGAFRVCLFFYFYRVALHFILSGSRPSYLGAWY